MSQEKCAFHDLKLESQLCFALYRTMRAVTQIYRPFLDQIGLTYPQYLVMLVLWEDDHLALKKIGDRLMLDSGTLTPMIKKMEAQGLLCRQKAKEDEREIRISLTSSGRLLKKKAQHIPEKMGCQIDFAEDKRERLLLDLNELFSGLKR